MKNRKIYLGIIAVLIVLVVVTFSLNNSATEEELKVRAFYPEAKKITLIKDIVDDPFISINMPAVRRAYEVDGVIKAYVVSCMGYIGPVELLAAIDDANGNLIGIEILNHIETPSYADHIEETWFTDRLINILIDKYLNLVVLDKENPEDIIQVTGATISSQAVVNAVNAAIGAYQYQQHGIRMGRVPDVVPREMWQQDINSFAINWENGSFRVNSDSLKEYDQVEADVRLINTTGTELLMKVKGPTLRHVLEREGLDLSNYEGIGITARDGYYTLVDKEKLEKGEVILVWEVDGKAIKDEDKPMRIAMPEELGPYWVKMVSNIDLYETISKKSIDKIHMFEALTRDIEPYYYEYYGSKDKSYEIGKILMTFDEVDIKGLFTMNSVDGLIKNETISMVAQRYFLKVEGDNAPMNIAPAFKLGMNVKYMTHFSTTRDAVIFPEQMQKVERTQEIDGKTGLSVEDVLLTVGMSWPDNPVFNVVSAAGIEYYQLNSTELSRHYLILDNGIVDLYRDQSLVLNDVLRIEKP
jgi:Na+-translocating ferredoxin:NAD+ oxidoreductase RnfG subunit